MSKTPDILKNPLTNKGTAFTLEERAWRDVVIVATVSAIYGIGAPDDYLQMRRRQHQQRCAAV